MSTDPVYQALKNIADSLATIRRGQLDDARGDADPCDHMISTLHHGRRGLPIFAQCRRAEAHSDLHEDEHGRQWHPNGLLVEPEEA
ncbi:hypothetical protein NE857_31500 [Nocardiopsis exhalans]|uniref:Uncharacterized protein n=1 Tax=Nocardiopsis exhalans TaxID=163604 RepID=A0ABY5D8J7_9ACTN|nr:hypothetical protein [Nocardiopsis exhalans]USY19705.1 hypothetical protein NE857_31500 [Nocardiopsis exhalans]